MMEPPFPLLRQAMRRRCPALSPAEGAGAVCSQSCSPGMAGGRCQGVSGAAGLHEGLCGVAELARADAHGGSIFPEWPCATLGAAPVCCLPQLQVTRALGRR